MYRVKVDIPYREVEIKTLSLFQGNPQNNDQMPDI